MLVGGNIGTPAISFVETATADTWIVLEISSFQLETIESFHPKIAVVLNVTPDHLDRHYTFENYAAAKARILENQTADDFAVLNADNAPCVAMAAKAKAPVYWFSRLKEVERGAFARGEQIFWRDGKTEREIMPVSEISLKGSHNVENVLAAVCVGMLAGIEPAQIREAVAAFKAVEHRLEYVATVARRRILQRFESDQRRRDHQGAGVVSRPDSPHSRRQGQRQRLQRAESSAEGASQARVHDRRRGRKDRVAGEGRGESSAPERWRMR